MLERHPCFHLPAAGREVRLHLPVAGRCNLACNYCDRRYDCANESRPGVTSRLLRPAEALDYLAGFAGGPNDPAVVGFAGPGDPLYNEETFETMSLVHRAFPEKILCLSTNGLLLPDRAAELWELGVRFLTVTLNTLRPETGARIYRRVRLGSRTLRGREGAEVLLERQLAGLETARRLGFHLKLNTLLLPGVNEEDLEPVAWQARALGVHRMNLIPLIPAGRFRDLPAPTPATVTAWRRRLRPVVAQMTHCQSCRADAVGRVLGGEHPC